jgi:serine/threonine protein kinase
MFAFGVLLFRLLSGERPFPNADEEMLKRDTLELRYSVQGSDWKGVSSAAKDLVNRLLIHRQERLTAEQALEHPWFSEVGASVLRPDLSCSLDRPDSVRSKAFLLVGGDVRESFALLCHPT